jgi:(R,R)-butanediol dehydrogenase/meso-butanediol dehydrogenase/diacetyl reductase
MKAAVYPGNGAAMVIETRPDPEPLPGELLIRVHRCGICGTDLHMTEGHDFQFPANSVPGHEYAGEVIALGKDVTDWKIGDKLTALPSTGCGQCVACQHGNWVLCHNAPGLMGGFAEYMRVPTGSAVRLPGAFSLGDGALIEPLAVGRYGVRQAAIGPETRVLVLGGGTVALCAIWWARVFGAGKIVAMSRSLRRAELALAMGAGAFVQFGENETAEIVEALGGAPDVVFECVGNPGYLAKGVEHVAKFGEVISMGFCTAPDQIVPARAAFKAATLRFPVGYALADFTASLDQLEHGHADPAMLVTSVVGLDQLPETFAMLRAPNRETKVQVAI